MLFSRKLRLTLFFLNILFGSSYTLAQELQQDSLQKKPIIFSGSVGLSSNGFSIVPTFSLNSPASMMLLSIRKGKFSFDPDIRLTPNAKKGSMIFWFRYHAITNHRYTLRIGVHPAMNFQARVIQVNSELTTISQMRRFLAWEVSNDYRISNHARLGLYYLQANGLQKDGARTTHFIGVNLGITDVHLPKNFRLSILPTVYYLYLDAQEGAYVSGNVVLSNKKWPFSFQHAFNKTLRSNIAGNKDYMWNVSLHYHFKNSYTRINLH